MRWESGEMTQKQTVKFFAQLIKNGMAWTLQGCYGRTACDYIESGMIDRKGNITKRGKEILAKSEEE
jgi:hypothetical protein